MPPSRKSSTGKDSKRAKPARGRGTPKRKRHTKLRLKKPDADAVPSIGPGFKSFADLKEALRFLYSRINVEMIRPRKVEPQVWRLDRMHALMGALDDPHRAFKSVHVAGSKGKGSVCEMLAAALIGCGLTTGLYTSPHVIDIRERIRLNGEMVSERDFVRLVSEVALAADGIKRRHGAATYFELLTAAAYLHYAQQAVDVGVIEVGLGGRLDSTNVIIPEVTAITAIQLEHTQILGDSLDKIAREKAGILKPGVPALTIPQQKPIILETFKEVAAKVNAPLAVLGTDIEYTSRFEASNQLGPHMRISVTTPRSEFEHVPVPLKGEHQAANCGLVLAILDRLRERGLPIKERDAVNGLARTKTLGRLEQVFAQPRIFVDGAHNPESIQALIKSLGAHLRYDSLIVIFGCASDKDVPTMLQKLGAGADKVIFTKAEHNARAADPKDLLRRFGEHSQKMAQTAASVKDAINIAAKAAGRDDLIVVTGSFYVAGEAKRLLEEKKSRDGQVRVASGSGSPARGKRS